MLLGGIVAGIVNVVFGVILQVALQQGLLPEGFAPVPPLAAQVSVASAAIVFVIGMWAVWLYTAIRPRYGPGAMTALSAALGTWLLIALVPAFAAFTGGGSMETTFISLGIFFVSIVVATVAGAWLYKEE